MEKQGWPKPADWMQRHEYPGPVVELTAEEKRAFGEIGIDMMDRADALEAYLTRIDAGGIRSSLQVGRKNAR